MVSSPENLLYCQDSEGDLTSITRSNASTTYVYDGKWFVTRTGPSSLTNELEGEIPIYTSECSFRISEENTGISSLSYYVENDGYGGHGDPPMISVSTTWVREFCCNDGSIAFVVRTCAHVTNGNGKWVKLSNPSVIYDMQPHNGFQVLPLNTGSEESCSLSQGRWYCCQKWLISGVPGNVQAPSHGRLLVRWDALIFNLNYVKELKDTPCWVNEVKGCFFFNVSDRCLDADTLKLKDQVRGDLEIYKDDMFLDEWDYEKDGALEDGCRFYSTLTPAIAESVCSNYFIEILEIKTKQLNCSGRESDPEAAKVAIVFRKNSTHTNTVYDSWVNNNPDGACTSRMSWMMKRGLNSKRIDPSDDATMGRDQRSAFKNSGKQPRAVSERKRDLLDIALAPDAENADELTTRNDESLGKKRKKRIHGPIQEGDCKTVVTVTWELIPKYDRGSSLLEKRHYPIVHPVLGCQSIRPFDYSVNSAANVYVKCRNHQIWDDRLGYCTWRSDSSPFYYANYLWVLIFVIAIVLLLACCLFPLTFPWGYTKNKKEKAKPKKKMAKTSWFRYIFQFLWVSDDVPKKTKNKETFSESNYLTDVTSIDETNQMTYIV